MTDNEQFMITILNRMFTQNPPTNSAFNILYTEVWPFKNPLFKDAVRAMRARGKFFVDRKSDKHFIHVFNFKD